VARPPWLQVYGFLRARIASGEFGEGGRLPPVRALSQEYGVAPATTRKALLKLREENVIVTIRGWGNFVREEQDG
jgi:DNA-binding GntR family transcriptional regulator